MKMKDLFNRLLTAVVALVASGAALAGRGRKAPVFFM